MFIKEIVLDGFKSYATRTVISGFDPEFNAITGLNGSGKSNVLDAICFVLGISNLTQVRAGSLNELYDLLVLVVLDHRSAVLLLNICGDQLLYLVQIVIHLDEHVILDVVVLVLTFVAIDVLYVLLQKIGGTSVLIHS